ILCRSTRVPYSKLCARPCSKVHDLTLRCRRFFHRPKRGCMATLAGFYALGLSPMAPSQRSRERQTACGAAAVALWAMLAPISVAESHATRKTDLYVSPTGSDSNDGSPEAPFRSILAASRAARPNTTIHVASGTYRGGFMTKAIGAPSAPITY